MTTQPARRAMLIANPHSGRGRNWIFRLLDRLDRSGIELVSTHFDLDSGRIKAALRVGESRGVEIVLAAGGDGTQGAVSACLAYTSFTLGVLPTGTANDFARSLNIPIDPEGAVDVVVRGRATRVDLGQVSDRVFCHVATLGINTQFAAEAQRLRPILHRASYPVAAGLAYARRKRFRVLIETDGQHREQEALEVAIINTPVYGGPLHLEVSNVNPDDQKLQMLVVTDVPPSVIVQALPLLLEHRPLRVRGVTAEPTKSARIETDPPMPLTLDGEPGPCTPVEVNVLPAALRVFVPSAFEEGRRGTSV